LVDDLSLSSEYFQFKVRTESSGAQLCSTFHVGSDFVAENPTFEISFEQLPTPEDPSAVEAHLSGNGCLADCTTAPVEDGIVLNMQRGEGSEIHLLWNAVGAPLYYVVGGDTPQFIPGADTLLGTTTSTTFVDESSMVSFYLVQTFLSRHRSTNSARLRPMRRILALGCCVLYLVFGFVAGAAHLHESADHHAESRGLHLDHAHVGHATGHEHGSSAHFDARHVAHHDGDVLYLSATALRSLDGNTRLMPATVAVGATVDPPTATSDHDATRPGHSRAPPRSSRTRPRAPPA